MLKILTPKIIWENDSANQVKTFPENKKEILDLRMKKTTYQTHLYLCPEFQHWLSIHINVLTGDILKRGNEQ